MKVREAPLQLELSFNLTTYSFCCILFLWIVLVLPLVPQTTTLFSLT